MAVVYGVAVYVIALIWATVYVGSELSIKANIFLMLIWKWLKWFAFEQSGCLHVCHSPLMVYSNIYTAVQISNNSTSPQWMYVHLTRTLAMFQPFFEAIWTTALSAAVKTMEMYYSRIWLATLGLLSVKDTRPNQDVDTSHVHKCSIYNPIYI